MAPAAKGNITQMMRGAAQSSPQAWDTWLQGLIGSGQAKTYADVVALIGDRPNEPGGADGPPTASTYAGNGHDTPWPIGVAGVPLRLTPPQAAVLATVSNGFCSPADAAALLKAAGEAAIPDEALQAAANAAHGRLGPSAGPSGITSPAFAPLSPESVAKMQDTLKAYDPSLRDQVATTVLSVMGDSPDARWAVQALVGSAGIGDTNVSLADFVPGISTAFYSDEAVRAKQRGDLMGFAYYSVMTTLSLVPLAGAAEKAGIAVLRTARAALGFGDEAAVLAGQAGKTAGSAVASLPDIATPLPGAAAPDIGWPAPKPRSSVPAVTSAPRGPTFQSAPSPRVPGPWGPTPPPLLAFNGPYVNASHIVAEHKMKAWADLEIRAPRLGQKTASTFDLDESQIETLVDNILTSAPGQAKISALKAGTARSTEIDVFGFDGPTGRYVEALPGQAPTKGYATGVRVVIRKDPGSPTGFRVATAYPLP